MILISIPLFFILLRSTHRFRIQSGELGSDRGRPHRLRHSTHSLPHRAPTLRIQESDWREV